MAEQETITEELPGNESGRVEEPSTAANNDDNTLPDNDDVDDDGASILSYMSSSSSSSLDDSSDDEENAPMLSMLERQARNIARNQKFLGSLNAKYNQHLPKSSAKSKGDEDEEEQDVAEESIFPSRTTGILMKGSHRLFHSQHQDASNQQEISYVQQVQNILKRYPHRDNQIHQLFALLDANVSSMHSHIPAPIFCVGPASTGKTQIVCDVVEIVRNKSQQQQEQQGKGDTPATNNSSQHSHSSSMRAAYIDCSIVEPSSIERLVYSIYRQLPLYSSHHQSARRRTSKTKRSKKRRKISPGSDKGINEGAAKASSESTEKENDANRRVLPSRHAKIVTEPTAKPKTASNQAQVNGTNPQNKEEKVESSNSAVVSLGRSLQQHYGTTATTTRTKRLSAVLILDKAEELLTLSSADKKSSRRKRQKSLSRSSAGATASSNKTTNFLAELLLLPKIMKLDLTVVVITNYAMLDKTKLNNSISAAKSLATIANGVHPIVIQFPAYRGNRMFCDILSTPANQRLVMGHSLFGSSKNGMSNKLRAKLVTSFWNTVVQFVSDTTRDLRDFIHIGRGLWPEFIAPIQSDKIQGTMEAIAQRLKVPTDSRHALADHTDKLETEFLSVLGTRFHSHMASLSKKRELTSIAWNENGNIGAASPASADSSSFSFKRSCLLLAAFICQHNKASHDSKVFSIRGNGQRRKSQAMEDIYGGNDEDLAFGTASKSRAFVLERVFSIFVTLMRLNPTSDEEDLDNLMDSLGSTRLHIDLSYLIDLGYLRPTTHVGLVKGEQINLSTARFTCSLSHDEAINIAKQHTIPLEQYLL